MTYDVDFIIVRAYPWAFPGWLDGTEVGARRAEVWCCAKCGPARTPDGITRELDPAFRQGGTGLSVAGWDDRIDAGGRKRRVGTPCRTMRLLSACGGQALSAVQRIPRNDSVSEVPSGGDT
jgi:hypothetical protein